MELHPRLHDVNVKQKQASFTLDEFHRARETTHAQWGLQQKQGKIEYTVHSAAGELLLHSGAATVREALDAMAAFTCVYYEATVMDPGGPYGIDYIDV